MLDALDETAPRLLALAMPAVLGAIAARAKLFPDPDAAIGALNTYALYIAFPALIAIGLMDASLKLPSSPLFYLCWPICLAIILAALAISKRARPALGTLSLVTVFGNVAYLGLPYVRAALGEEVAGIAALAVAIHVTGAVTLGPLLLAVWGARGEARPSLARLAARVARQPLFWAPLVGLAMRMLPDGARGEASDWIAPLAASAAPVALFLLGAYLYEQRERLGAPDLPLMAHLGIRQLIAPALMALLMWGGHALGWIDAEAARVHIVLASMPVAITTFSMAHQAGARSDRVGAAIVWSSALSILALPLWTAIASALVSN